MTLQAAQQLLASPQLASAVHQVLRQYAPLVPALRNRSLESVALTLQSASNHLSFVRSCHTRLVRAPSTDVTRSDVSSQVRRCFTPPHPDKPACTCLQQPGHPIASFYGKPFECYCSTQRSVDILCCMSALQVIAGHLGCLHLISQALI